MKIMKDENINYFQYPQTRKTTKMFNTSSNSIT